VDTSLASLNGFGFTDGVLPSACPTRIVLNHVTSTWGVLVLVALSQSDLRWGELRRTVQGISEKMLAQTLRNNGDWVTEKYYEGFGHMEVVFSLGAMWRWRAPVLDDVVSFFQQFGAFPGGVPRVAATPDAPDTGQTQQMQGVIAKLDSLMSPIESGRRNE